MTTLTPPKSHIPIGMDSNGNPVSIHPEWLRYLTQSLFTRSGGTQSLNVDDIVAMIENDLPASSTTDVLSQEAIRRADEVANELASVRNQCDMLKAQLEEVSSRLESIPTIDPSIPGRVADIEVRLM